MIFRLLSISSVLAVVLVGQTAPPAGGGAGAPKGARGASAGLSTGAVGAAASGTSAGRSTGAGGDAAVAGQGGGATAGTGGASAGRAAVADGNSAGSATVGAGGNSAGRVTSAGGIAAGGTSAGRSTGAGGDAAVAGGNSAGRAADAGGDAAGGVPAGRVTGADGATGGGAAVEAQGASAGRAAIAGGGATVGTGGASAGRAVGVGGNAAGVGGAAAVEARGASAGRAAVAGVGATAGARGASAGNAAGAAAGVAVVGGASAGRAAGLGGAAASGKRGSAVTRKSGVSKAASTTAASASTVSIGDPVRKTRVIPVAAKRGVAVAGATGAAGASGASGGLTHDVPAQTVGPVAAVPSAAPTGVSSAAPSGDALTAAAAVPATTEVQPDQSDPGVIRAQQNLDRIRGLVQQGAMPMNSLTKAQDDLQDARDMSILRFSAFTRDLTVEQADQMVTVAMRMLLRRERRATESDRLMASGVISRDEARAGTADVLNARLELDLATERAHLVRDLAQQKARVEIESEAEMHPEWNGQVYTRYDGNGVFTRSDFEKISTAFYMAFHKVIPVTADGQTALHKSMGFNHTGRIDIGLSPDQPEGSWLLRFLQKNHIPYFAFRAAVAHKATGAHIHLGPGSTKLVALLH